MRRWKTKKSCLVAKRDQITSKLADESLPAERRHFLTSKLEKIQEKITFLETKQQQISQDPQEHSKGRGAGGRGGCGRGQRGNRDAEHQEPKCGEQDQHKKFWHEKMENKRACLVAKRDQLQAKLADESLPAERRIFLSSKLEKVQERISFFEAKQQESQNHQGPRGGRGPCSRGIRGGLHQRPTCGEQDQQNEKPCWGEWMNKRQAKLAEKKESINAKLVSDQMTPERRSVLTGKLAKVEEKIKAIEARKEQLKNHQEAGPGCRRGGRGQGNRGHPGCGRGGKHFGVDQMPK